MSRLLFYLLLSWYISFNGYCDANNDNDFKITEYNIPNPFEKNLNKRGFYRIESYQVTISSAQQSARIEVKEYFSFKKGLSFSIYKNKDDKTLEPFLIINDGLMNKSYIIRNYSQNLLSSGRYDCELDHLHHSRHLFPWQYDYKKEDQKDSFIYGVGAIWLNAIKRKVTTKFVGQQSAYPDMNRWHIELKDNDNDVEVDLLFQKPDFDKKIDDSARMQEAISKTSLNSIYVKRFHHQVSDDDEKATHFISKEVKDIYIQEFDYIKDPSEDNTVSLLLKTVGKCRKLSKDHRLFPNLLREIQLSRERMFTFDYVTTINHNHEVKKHHRQHKYHHELNTEWFSFKKETSIHTYRPMLYNTNEKDGDFDPNTVDVYMKRFTDKANEHRSSRRASTIYHFLEDIRSNIIDNCKINESDEPSSDESYLIRSINFYTKEGHRISTKLTGIGAMLINAADSHHKHFNLFTKEIEIIDDILNVDGIIEIKKSKINVDEWSLYHKHSKRVLKFYFRQLVNSLEHQQIKDLVRIDVCLKQETDSDEPATTTTGSDNYLDGDVLLRYDIMRFETDFDEQELEFIFGLPEVCKPEVDDTNTESEYSSDEDYVVDADSDADDYYSKEEDEEFEFNPGNLYEPQSFPDFFQFMADRVSYSIISEIQFAHSGRKTLTLKENVDMEDEQAIYSLHEEKDQEPLVEFFVNYNSEIVFKVNENDNKMRECILLSDIQDELMGKISAPIKYYKSAEPDTGKTVIESSKINLFGIGALWRLASRSDMLQYQGFQILQTDKSAYLEYFWSLISDDSNILYEFVFRREKQAKKSDDKIHKNQAEFMNLKYIAVKLKANDTKDQAQEGKNDDDGEEQQYAPEYIEEFLIEPKWIDDKPKKVKFNLPAECSKAMNEARQQLDKLSRTYSDDVTIPSLKDYITRTDNEGAYTIQYTLTHRLIGSANSISYTTNSLPIVESYDLAKNKGKLVIGLGLDRQYLFIDGQLKKMFLFLERTNQCKQLDSFKGLVDLGGSFMLENNDFDRDKLYGLGELWLRLAKFQNVSLKVTYILDESGYKQEIRTYKSSTSYSETPTNIIQFNIIITFVERLDSSRRNKLTDKDDHLKRTEFDLKYIEIIPQRIRGIADSRLDKYRSSISVISFEPVILNDDLVETLPEACKELQIKGTGFPSLSKLIEVKGEMYMRSELSSGRSLRFNTNDRIQLTFVEEWLLGKQMRIRTVNLDKNNIDILIYGSTRELFDLSTKNQCSWILPKLVANKRASGLSQMDENELKWVEDFWQDDTRASLSKIRPSLIYFAPIALWLLAERTNRANVKLMSYLNLAPDSMILKNQDIVHKLDHDNLMEREMRIESWLITSEPDERPQWRYIMNFERASSKQLDGTKLEWFLLDSITIEEFDRFNTKMELEVAIINYDYHLKPDDIVARFNIPDGYGCKRGQIIHDQLSQVSDEFVLNKNMPHELHYEASLEIASDEDEDQARGGVGRPLIVLPNLRGVYQSTGSYSLDGHVLVSHTSRTRFLDGTTKGEKIVTNQEDPLLYRIDLLKNYCKIERSHRESIFKLIFINPPSSKTITIDLEDPQLFELLFMRTSLNKFNPINRWITSDGFQITKYELAMKELGLIGNLSGPASVTRSYLKHRDQLYVMKDKSATFHQHNDVETRVYIYDDDRSQIKAILTIRLFREEQIGITDVIRSSNVARCYNNGDSSSTTNKRIGSYGIQYKFKDTDSIEWISMNSIHLEEQLIERLVKHGGLWPTQLIDSPQVRFINNGLIEINFNLLEAPSSIDYFEMVYHATMTYHLIIYSDMKILANINDCSIWCDQVNCRSFSYCSDGRVCRLLTLAALLDAGQRKLIGDISQSQPDETCYYYYNKDYLDRKPNSLANFVSLMTSNLISSIPATKLSEFELTIDSETIIPSDLIEYFNGYIDDIDYRIGTIMKEYSSLTWQSNMVFDLEAMQKSILISVEFIQVNSHAECLEKCSILKCPILSYCTQGLATCTILRGNKDLKQIMEYTINRNSTGNSCSITARDYRGDYNLFKDTVEPKQFKLRLDDYTSMECASACSIKRPDFRCLSFDFCRIDTNNNQMGSCYLQDLHLLSDSFDRSLFVGDRSSYLTSGSGTSSNKSLSCDHYSKFLLDDFDEIENKMISEDSSSIVETGIGKENCAEKCQQTDQCSAFEYCYESTVDKTCRLILDVNLRLKIETNQGDASQTDYLKDSNICSIFILSHHSQMEQLTWTTDDSIHKTILLRLDDVRKSAPIQTITTTLIYILSAVCLGSILQFVSIKLIGRSIVFRY